MTSATSTAPTMSLAETRKIVGDLFGHRPAVYWTDFLVTAIVAWSVFVFLAMRTASGNVDGFAFVAYVVAGFAMLRAALFIHEISHFRRGVMPGFRVVWNVLFGVPMLVPAFIYDTHIDHHKRNLYGTVRDPEYVPLALQARPMTILFVVETLLAPVVLVLRFGVFGPLSWLVAPLRRILEERVSALVVNKLYVRRRPTTEERRRWFVVEAAAFGWIGFVTFMIASGRWSMSIAVVWYAVAAFVSVVNQIRTLAAHHYENDGAAMSVVDQLLDSCNVRGLPILTPLVFPVGLRFHGLHHYLPDMPYHALPRAHRRLMAKLPDDSPYRATDHAGWGAVMRNLWRHPRDRDAASRWAEGES